MGARAHDDFTGGCMGFLGWGDVWICMEGPKRRVAVRVREQFATFVLDPRPDPPRCRRPFLCYVHPYCYRFYNSVPGCTRRIPLANNFLDVWQCDHATRADNKQQNLLFYIHGGG